MIFGELYPKNLAIANPEPAGPAGLAGSTLVYMTVFGWLISFFDKVRQPVAARAAHLSRSTTWTIQRLGRRPSPDQSPSPATAATCRSSCR